MENATNLNENFFILNTINMVQQNSTLPSPFSTWTITTVTVCSIGILANILVISSILVSSLKYSLSMNLIMNLAIFDSMYLISEITVQRGLFGQLFIKPSLLNCPLNTFFIYVFAIISSWLTVFISLERYIALYYPFKVHIYCTKMHTYFAIIALKILTCISCIPFFYSCSITWLDGMPVCGTCGENSEYDIISMSIILAFYSIVPFILITTLNILMKRKIQLQKAFRSQLQQPKGSSPVYDSSLTVMMICVCFIFAVTSLPGSIFLIISHSCKFKSGSFCMLSYDRWLTQLTFMLEDINHGINFFLYCLTGSVFRVAFFHLFQCKVKKSPEHNFEQQMTTTVNS